ncbi:MAG: nitroreductase family protein [Paludibacteraceae bacterium]|nr:nitroreductase family protein [Paludibacteraceae bacterium]
MLQQLINHKTIRRYTDAPISEQTLNRILTAACRASNTGGMQTYSIVVTLDKEIKKQLAPAHFNQPMVTEAPAVITFCVDFNRFNHWCALRNAKPGYGNLLSLSSAIIDACLASQNFAVAAESEGLGICYLGTTTYNARSIIKTLKLPKYVVPITTITVGYPTAEEKEKQQEDRLPLDGICHHEIYEDYPDSEIERIYRYKENLPQNKQFVLENKKETLAQVFTDIRYTQQDAERISVELLDVFREQGFQI